MTEMILPISVKNGQLGVANSVRMERFLCIRMERFLCIPRFYTKFWYILFILYC